MKNWKKIATAAAAVALSATLVFSVTACSDTDEEEFDLDAYYDLSDEIYDEALGEFYEVYKQAKAETNTDKRYALMAVAEAKLLESAVMLPIQAKGGSYAITKAAPYTYPTVLWGNDADRYHQTIVTKQFIASSDIAKIREIYNEYISDSDKSGSDYEGVVGGDGVSATAYSNAVKSYLQKQGYEFKDTYSIAYTSDPNTYDVLSSSKAIDGEVLVNTYDGLLEYDELGNLQYALADYVVENVKNSDGTVTYYFHIRSGDNAASWYSLNDTNTEYADVTADDFVAGFQHMLDAQGGLSSLVEGIITGVSEYTTGETTDFGDVGVEAGTYDKSSGKWTAGDIDTDGAQEGEWVAYTLESECSYFLTMLSYAVFAPMNRDYFLDHGGAFGLSAFSTASASTNYTYGTTRNTILYCGPYFITNATSKSSIVFTANPKYWNYENINVKILTWYYNDGTDSTQSFKWAISDGNVSIDYTTLNSTVISLIEGSSSSYTTTDIYNNTGTYFDLYGYTTATESTSYMAFYNLNRYSFANYNDGSTAKSSQTTTDAERTNAAMNNVHFRRAISFAFDRTSYMAQSVGESLASVSLRNSYVPGNFVQCGTSGTVTYELSGKEYTVTYSEDDYYGEILQAQLDEDGFPVTVWATPTTTTTTENGTTTYTTTFQKNADGTGNSSDGYDGWYNVDNAVAELKQAIEELKEEGIEVSESNPIYIDYVCFVGDTTKKNMGYSYQKSIQDALGGKVVVNIIEASSTDDWYYSSYYCDYGYQMNYDMTDISGWGPDYGDPSTYLDTMLPDSLGYMTIMLGLY